MADNYKTMRLVRTDHPDVVCYWGLFQCQVCHGKVYDRDPVSPSDRESISRRVSEMTCSLCDESAPLSEQYWMGLNTLCRSVWPPRYWNQEADASIFGFPSFRRIYRRDGDMDGMTASFDDDDLLVTAGADGISVKAPGKHSVRYEFSDRLDAAYPPLFSRRLAREFVDRVRHDLKLKYAKEA